MNKHIHIGRAAAALAVALALQGACLAQEVIVTADRVASEPAAVTVDATVIDRETIEKSGARNVADLLRRVVAIDVANSGGPGKATSVFLRGTGSGHALVLIDGVRVGSATLGQFDWANMSTTGIERIEIVRGPQSSLYGADAIGGVIQIFTRGEQVSGARAAVEAGGLGTSRVLAEAGSVQGGVRYHLYAENYRTRGVSAAAGGAEPDSFASTSWGANLELPVGDGVLRIDGRSSDGTSGLDGGFPFGDVIGYAQRLVQHQLGVALEYPVLERWSTTLRLARSEDYARTSDPATPSNNSSIRTRIDQWSWENRIDLGAAEALLGLEQHRDRGVNPAQGIDKRMDQTAAFASLGWHVSTFDLTASARRDRNSLVEDRTTWRVGVGAHPMDGLKLFANYGTGFKAPSLNDLFWPATAWSAGNPNLKPESARGWDAGLAWDGRIGGGSLSLSATWFSEDVRNLINWAETAPFFWQPSNVDRARIRGLELAFRAAFGAISLRGNWTVQDAKNAADNTWLSRRAHEKGGIGVGVTRGRWGADAWLAIVGPRFSSAGNAKPMHGYRKLDISGWVAIDDRLRLTGRVENAENAHYEEVAGYGVMPRVWYLGVEGRY